ncbi:MAG: SDR family oxidoreductase [Planctomycetota bacterium]|nr:MAG: SDR family oxidoreductase [Planctomycetota bacterium]
MDLVGRVALVTGGGVRIGAQLCLALAEAGCDVVVHYAHSRDAAEHTVGRIREIGRTAWAVHADFSRDGAIAASRLFGEVLRRAPKVDLLINNAAIFGHETLVGTTAEVWRRYCAINLEAPLFLCRAFAEYVATHPSTANVHDSVVAKIVNILDWRALRPISGGTAYAVTKAALAALTIRLAQELAPRITVNGIAPGAILPPPGGDEEELRQRAHRVPLRRPGTPQDVADAVLFLLRSDFVTGEIIHVSGGEGNVTAFPETD